jgi:calcyphosin
MSKNEDLVEIAEGRIRKTLFEQYFGDKSKMERKLKQIFSQYDVDGSGELSYDEFECAMVKDLNMVGMRKEVKLIFDKYDDDCSESINYKEFCSVVLGKRTDIDPNTKNIVQKVKNMLIQHGGANGLRTMTVILRRLDINRNGKLDEEELHEGLEVYGIHPDPADMKKILKYFDRSGDGSISVTEFLRGLRGSMAKRRVRLVKKAFELVDKSGDGIITVKDLIGAYDVSQHPLVKEGTITEEEVLSNFLHTWDKSHDGIVTWSEFLDYYKDISVGIHDDEYFELMMRNAWHMTGGEGVYENTSNLRVLVVHEDGSQTVEEIKNDLGLKHTDKEGIMERLKKQGIKDIKNISLGSG